MGDDARLAATWENPKARPPRGKDEAATPTRAIGTAVVCSLLVVLVGAIDYATGFEARVFPLYYLPIALGALKVSRAAGLVLAGLSTVLWAAAMSLSGAGWGARPLPLQLTHPVPLLRPHRAAGCGPWRPRDPCSGKSRRCSARR